MSVSPTTSATAQVISSAAAGYIKNTTGSGSTSSSSAAQEATETPDVTAKEAAKGDRQAIRLLAQRQQAKQLEDPTPAQEPGKGDQIDQKA